MESTALVIVNVQKAIDCYSENKRNNLAAEKNIALLLAYWRCHNLPVFHVRHSSKFASSPYHQSSANYEFKFEVSPLESETIITKQENCAFLNTNLEKLLKQQGIKQLVVCGVLINNSVDVTVRVASGLGFKVVLPSDATAAFAIDGLNGKYYPADDVHWLFLTNLDTEYCEVSNTNHVIDNV